MKRMLICLTLAALCAAKSAAQSPVSIIFDTDLGNDVDDALIENFHDLIALLEIGL